VCYEYRSSSFSVPLNFSLRWLIYDAYAVELYAVKVFIQSSGVYTPVDNLFLFFGTYRILLAWVSTLSNELPSTQASRKNNLAVFFGHIFWCDCYCGRTDLFCLIIMLKKEEEGMTLICYCCNIMIFASIYVCFYVT